MHDLIDVLDSRSSRLLMLNDSADKVQESYVVNHDDNYIKQYVDHYVNKCPWRPELASKPKGLLYSSYLDFSCKQKAFKRTEFYNDWAKPQNIEHGMCGTVFQQQGNTIQLLVQRTKQAGHFTREETNFVNSLVPHIQNAISLRHNMESMQAVEHRVATLADRYSQPFALLDEQMKVCFISQLMKEEIQQSNGLKLASEKLLAKDSNENAKLYRLIRESSLTASGLGNSGGGMVSISADYTQGLLLKVMPFPHDLDNIPTFFSRSFVVVFLTSTRLKFSLEREHLTTQYGLTERESQLAALLCEGLSVDEIAECNGVQASTLRKQLKSIFVKTGTHRQGELIVTLLNSLASFRS
jgi:DNA-binding CsgD family transcriptional regulator